MSYSLSDKLVLLADHALKTLLLPAHSQRPHPDVNVPEADLSQQERRQAAALMRVNHCGEICAQALYQGQALTARTPALKQAMAQAAREEEEHLAWTAARVKALGSHVSWLNPLWYTGSLAIGVGAGLVGDRWNLGFLAETERQVVAHLESHLRRLPAHDAKSRAIVEQMKIDEGLHADMAIHQGAANLVLPIRLGMKLAGRCMTSLSYYL